MKLTLGLIFFSFIYSAAYCQDDRPITSFDSLIHKKIYRIKFSNYQIVELISFQDQTFSGRVINSVWRTNKKGNKNKLELSINHIEPSEIRILFKELFMANIETLPTCREVEGCRVGMDGLYVNFDINIHNSNRNYWYWEPENDHYQNTEVPEIQSVRKILSAIKARINLEGLFEEFTDSLSEGIYSYGGIVMQKLEINE